MNQENNSLQPNFELPEPEYGNTEANKAVPTPEFIAGASFPEIVHSNLEKPPIQQNPPAAAPPIDPTTAIPQVVQNNSAVPHIPTQASSQSTTSSGATTAPPVAEDSDLIEKEWVIKAKEIVERTRDDPYRQNQELNKFKADYMKKRYNKDIKLGKE